jgi:hypothetical protein
LPRMSVRASLDLLTRKLFGRKNWESVLFSSIGNM